ncbi:MAG: hypothetical protein NXI04_07235 [Planctomycetaceae bacterium]|nr:hypothetical protein [Planctomycetaceae bacterium]
MDDSRQSDFLGLPVARRRFLKLGLMSAAGMASLRPAAADELLQDLSTESLLAYSRLERAIRDLDGFLRAIDFQKNAFIGVNYFGVSVGGIDALKDLEEGRGVDPETFAALYAGFAVPSVARHLNMKKQLLAGGGLKLQIESPDGRLRYKGAAIRLYSRQKLSSLFDRRAAFRTEDDRKRNQAMTRYVARRLADVGNVRAGSNQSEITELSERYRRLKPLVGDLETALRADVSTSSILADNDPHLFGMSVGGLDVQQQLTELGAVDPISFGGILADKLSADHATRVKFTDDGRILYDDQVVRMCSQVQMESYFKRRERLSQLAKNP